MAPRYVKWGADGLEGDNPPQRMKNQILNILMNDCSRNGKDPEYISEI